MSEDQSPYDHGEMLPPDISILWGQINEIRNMASRVQRAMDLPFLPVKLMPIAHARNTLAEFSRERNALREENAKLKKRVDYLEKKLIKTQSDFIDRNAQYGVTLCEVEALRSQRDRLRSALEPFAKAEDDEGADVAPETDLFDMISGLNITFGDIRNARSAYEEAADPVCKDSLRGETGEKTQ